MLNIIVPLAGTGSRFLRDGYTRPKPFIKARGKELVLWLLEGLVFQAGDVLVMIFNDKPEIGMSPAGFFIIVQDYVSSLPNEAKPELKLVCMDSPTVGAAETVFRGLRSLSPDRLNLPAVLLDGDTFYSDDVLGNFRKMCSTVDLTNPSHITGGCVAVFVDDKPNESPYSYVKVEKHSDIVTHIKEKSKEGMSRLACSGCYGFFYSMALMTEIQTALTAYMEKHERSEVQHELYTSAIISNMLSKGGYFKTIKLEGADFTVLGTPAQLISFITSAGSTKQEKKRVCVDLDNTLVTNPTVPGDYTTCKPIHRVINYIRNLHACGHYIIIHTARRMRTHGGNIGRVTADIGRITIDQLSEYGIPHDELIFGKPFADFYIDDKAILPFVDELHKETGFMA